MQIHPDLFLEVRKGCWSDQSIALANVARKGKWESAILITGCTY